MVNEAHNGLSRCVRTRRVGATLLPDAHRAGVRRLAMEALTPAFAAEANETRHVPAAVSGYLAQPEMRELIAAALGLGWTLVAYEADFDETPSRFAHLSLEETNWREDQQARNLCAALQSVPDDGGLLVWCGNHHLAKHHAGEWVPMRVRFAERAGVDTFAIDQTPTVKFGRGDPDAMQWVETYRHEIEALGGSAGFLSEEAPPAWPPRDLADAYVVALDNELE